ncbi:MAG: right-handed parallel beta-helix repeat-containing protein, partial [Verrucomicrobiota bacterium]
LKATWTNLTDVEVLVFHEWATSRLRLSDVNEAECIATVAGGTHRGLNRGGRFLVENVKEALIPGEWYLDRKKGELTYLPLPGERLDKSVIIAPRHDRVLEIKGDVPGKKWVEGLCFSGLTFAHGNWTTPPNGNCIPQAESSMPAAVYAEGARNCTFTGCTFTLMGGYCLELGDGCQHDLVESCECTDIGGGAAFVSRAI